MPYSSEYCPRFAISSSCEPTSTSRDPSSTTIRSAILTVEKRCDTRTVMRPLPFAKFEPEEILERAGEPCTPLVSRHARERRVVDRDRSGRRLVHLREQLDERRLAGAVLADDRDHRSRRQCHRHVVQHEA